MNINCFPYNLGPNQEVVYLKSDENLNDYNIEHVNKYVPSINQFLPIKLYNFHSSTKINNCWHNILFRGLHQKHFSKQDLNKEFLWLTPSVKTATIYGFVEAYKIKSPITLLALGDVETRNALMLFDDELMKFLKEMFDGDLRISDEKIDNGFNTQLLNSPKKPLEYFNVQGWASNPMQRSQTPGDKHHEEILLFNPSSYLEDWAHVNLNYNESTLNQRYLSFQLKKERQEAEQQKRSEVRKRIEKRILEFPKLEGKRRKLFQNDDSSEEEKELSPQLPLFFESQSSNESEDILF